MSTNQLNARIIAVGVIIVGQLAVLTAVLNSRLAPRSLGWVAVAEVLCFVAAVAVGLTVPRRPAVLGHSRARDTGHLPATFRASQGPLPLPE